jgi:hypothetical protein
MKRIGTTTTTRARGKEPHVAAQHSAIAPEAQRRHHRRWIESHVRNRGGNAACEIEGEIAASTQPIFHRRAEQRKGPHVENEMQPAAVEKHHGEEGNQIGSREISVAVCHRDGVARRDEREVAQEFLELGRA